MSRDPLLEDAYCLVLQYHQGGSSPIGQSIREALGLGQHDPMTDAQNERASRIRALASSEPGEAYKPIERDESMGREYIPMPGGWEIQTKGSGSTFRIAGPDEDDRLPIEPRPYLHETLTKMARAVNAAWAAHPPTAAAPVGIVGERGDVSWRSDQILPVGTKLYAHPRTAATQPDSLCAKHLANCTFPKCDCTEDTQPEQVREVDEAMQLARVIGHGSAPKHVRRTAESYRAALGDDKKEP